MLIKDVVSLACEFTENQELIEKLKNNSLNEEEQLIIDSLVRCFNLINNEIATEYLPYVKTELLKTKDFKIKFSDFKNKVLNILSVKDKYGRKIKFKSFNDYIVAVANEVEIVYIAIPEEKSLQEELNSAIPERIFAYGMAREFFFLQSLFQEASLWDERFKNSLRVIIRKKNDIVMPRRRWI